MRVGLLGGSFDPAHKGHLHISLEALKRLALDEIWWLVSPQNPLKPAGASLQERLAGARKLVRHPRIRITDMERTLGTVYTVDTLRALKRRYPRHKFVWLMGADNLLQFPRWRKWRDIFSMIPMAIFDRAPCSHRALAGQAARAFARTRLGESQSRILAESAPPRWCFLHVPLNPSSSTELRWLQKRDLEV